MTAASTNSTFKQQSFANTTGVDTVIQQVAVEVIVGTPSDLTTNFPRVWIDNTTPTAPVFKISTNGTTVKTVTLT